MKLAGKIAPFTGGGTGIGKATAKPSYMLSAIPMATV